MFDLYFFMYMDLVLLSSLEEFAFHCFLLQT